MAESNQACNNFGCMGNKAKMCPLLGTSWGLLCTYAYLDVHMIKIKCVTR